MSESLGSLVFWSLLVAIYMCALKAGEAKGIGRVGLEKLLVPQDVPYHPDLPEAMRT